MGESLGQGCRRTGCTRGGATGGVLVGKSARPPLKRGLAAAAALPWTLRHVFHRCVVRPACLLSARLDLRMQPFEPFPESPDKSTSCAHSAQSQETNASSECDISEESNYSESLPVLSILNGCSSARKSINIPSNGSSIHLQSTTSLTICE